MRWPMRWPREATALSDKFMAQEVDYRQILHIVRRQPKAAQIFGNLAVAESAGEANALAKALARHGYRPAL